MENLSTSVLCEDKKFGAIGRYIQRHVNKPVGSVDRTSRLTCHFWPQNGKNSATISQVN